MIAMFLKIAGCMMIVFSTSMYGVTKSKELTKRISTLQSLKQVFNLLKGEIRFGLETLPNALINVSNHCGKNEYEVKEYLQNIGDRLGINKDFSLSDVWYEETYSFSKKTFLTEHIFNRLINFGEVFGYLDKKMQIDSLDLFLEYLDSDIKTEEKKYAASCKLYTGLGVMAGLFLVVIII